MTERVSTVLQVPLLCPPYHSHSAPLYALMRKLHWQPQSQRQRQHRRQRQRQRKAICLIAYRRFMASVWREKNKAKSLERW